MEQFISEIKLFAFDFAPQGWALCNGQLLSIHQNISLFTLIGTTYGGDGVSTFGLPDLRGKVLLASGRGLPSYFSGGTATHKLVISEMAAHNHTALASSNPYDINTPEMHYWASNIGYCDKSNASMSEYAIVKEGGDQSHDNMAPYLSMNYCIALTGVYPTYDKEEDDYAGTIKAFCNDRRPSNWLPCDGAEYLIASHVRLFSVIGYSYGGSGDKFKVPDLLGRVAIGSGKGDGLSNYELSESGSSATVTLTKSQLPKHSHLTAAKLGATTQRADGATWGNSGRPPVNFYATDKGKGAIMNANAIQNSGEGNAHNNLMPFITMPFFISADGEAPPKE